ncbi:putative Predicted signal transduction protein containing a membrane domain, an EAL and a GGDEF domain [Crenothrix polyspora]|uniref:Putative Predicted signal transduction protein containing a membrane domain, an EAL and a GGDEF domain n=1 Tax=Crenothrix polyspora TaxID=360316 RepID=A0A1R4GZL3_9GAMM|nr:EAL domain-containing protein [Crenothrix polyspora]SJM89395.1 putative Predicted signal transduction protein containing a membrane domain, an EAL and a GGDEF domain [Crenothrix polyspora]
MFIKMAKFNNCVVIVATLIGLSINPVAQANALLSPALEPSTDQMLSFLITGFSLGIAAYQVILYWCTRQTIYLHFSAALFGYVLGVGQMNSLWSLTTWPQASVSLVLDMLNLILFISFVKHFFLLFVNFKQVHPFITRAMNIYILFSALLILGYLLFPHPAFYKARSGLIVVACLTGLITIHRWYPTVKHLRTFVVTLVLFLLFMTYHFTQSLLVDNHQTALFSHLDFASGALMFLSFSSLITNRINGDREQRAIAQKTTIQTLEKYQTLYHNALEGLFTTLADGRLLEVNPALEKILGLEFTQQLIANQPFLQQHFVEPDSVWKKITHVLKQQKFIEGFEIQGQDNTWYGLSARHINTNNVDLIEGSLIDISLRKQQELQLSYLANHDPLTQLYNRNEFENYLQDAIRSQSTHTLLFIDLDQFKVINDTCGHAAGDECLRQVAAIFKEHTRQQDMLARLGGDEFGIVFWDKNQAVGKACAERIRLALEANHFQWLQRIFKTSASIGLITIDSRITCGEQALSLADAACYEAKDAGRNRVVINDPDKQVTIYRQSQMDMVATLTQALRDDQLTLFQQPIIALTSKPTGLRHYEVLVRLHTANGLLNPGAFLPAALRYDLLPQIDRWVFNRTCAWLAEGDNLAHTGMVNVNLSPQTLADPGFMIFIRKCLADHALISPAKICFEITEYSAINNFSLVLRNILKLRDLGFRFALDDFGSGFASFDHVKRLPVDFIKIDGRFIRELKQDVTNKTLVRAVAEIAHTLGKQVIAESVEDQETAAILSGFNIDFGQGYYFGRPAALYGQELLPVCAAVEPLFDSV